MKPSGMVERGGGAGKRESGQLDPFDAVVVAQSLVAVVKCHGFLLFFLKNVVLGVVS